MKLKFRASGKDFVIFILFSIALFYLVAIAVLNISNFASEGEFYGLNPMGAFSEEYLIPTLVGFVFMYAIIITSVSSYFFDRESGLGFTTNEKNQSGYSRWATNKEMKKMLNLVKTKETTSEFAGVPLINDGQNLYVDDSEFHSLILGATGSGKTQTIVLPLVESLAKKGESMIVTDPKGEIYEKTATMLRSRGYNVVLLNFRDTLKGNSWNPLALPYSLYQEGNKDKSNELLDDLAMNILYDEKAQSQDPFWEKTSADYFTGLSLALFEDAKKEEINLNSINLMTTVGEEKIGNTVYIKDYFESKDKASPAYINVSSTIMAPNDTKSSILSVFKQKIKLFSSRENLSEMLSYSDFDMKDIGRKRTAVFIVIQDEKKTYHSLVTIFIKQCYETLIDVAQELGGKLTYRTNFILDEFANMPPLKDVTTMVTAARSRNIRFNFIIQNFAQLYQVYGKENGETIKGNCGNIIYLISSELSALEEISKMCGEVKSKEKDKTASTPLVTVSDLQRLKEGEIIVLRTRKLPFKTKVCYDWKIDWGYVRENAPYPVRERKPIELFDLKSFVNDKREKKMNELMKNFSSNSDVAPKPVPTPLVDSTKKEPAKPSSSFNIDDIVKRIDAKLAKLDEEEKKENEISQIKNVDNEKEVSSSNSVVAPVEVKKESNVDDFLFRPDSPAAELEKTLFNLKITDEELKNETKKTNVIEEKNDLVQAPVVEHKTETPVSKIETPSSNDDLVVPVIPERKEEKVDVKPKTTKSKTTKVKEEVVPQVSFDEILNENNIVDSKVSSNVTKTNSVTSSKPIKDTDNTSKVSLEPVKATGNNYVESTVYEDDFDYSYISDDQFFDDFFSEED